MFDPQPRVFFLKPSRPSGRHPSKLAVGSRLQPISLLEMLVVASSPSLRHLNRWPHARPKKSNAGAILGDFAGTFGLLLGVDSPLFSTSVLFKNQLFSQGSWWFF